MSDEIDPTVLRLLQTVRIMRSFVAHDHREPYPCPVFLVDEAERAVRHRYGVTVDTGPLPSDLQAVFDAQMAHHVATLRDESAQ